VCPPVYPSGPQRGSATCLSCLPSTLHDFTPQAMLPSYPQHPSAEILKSSILLVATRDFVTSDVETRSSQPPNPRNSEMRWDSDPTVLPRPRSNGYPPSSLLRLCDLEHPMLGLSPCELPSSRDPLDLCHLSSSDGRL
jgi:hypothetical protein